MHRILTNQGFTFRRQGLSTDTKASLLIGLTTLFFAASVFYSETLSSTGASSIQDQTLLRLNYAPLLTLILFIFWALAWAEGLRNANRREQYWQLWNLSNVNGPFDWESGISSTSYVLLWASILVIVLLPAIYAISSGYMVTGVLNVVGCGIFFLGGVPSNRYVDARHRYCGDMLRISLPTSHHEGTAYVLPSKSFGFDAVWTPKVANEHLEADQQMMELFRNMRSGRWSLKEPLERLRSTLASFHQRLRLTPEDVIALARWLYLDPEADPSMRQIRCLRAPNIHLIGRDLMFALCHAEYIVFMGQGRVPGPLQAKLGTLRLMIRSGAAMVGEAPAETIGFKTGREGYTEAVNYVYALFGLEPDDEALNFDSTPPPKYSSTLSKIPEGINEYVDELWNTCTAHTESTFTALYMFTTVWFIEIGNTNGFHIFPLRCRTRQGDLVSQQVVWRQAWYCGTIAQLVALSPAFYAAFVIGYLQ